MKTLTLPQRIATFVLGATLVACSSSKNPDSAKPVAGPEPLKSEASENVKVTATVEAIDLSNRHITLRGPDGNSVTLVVDEAVKRFKEIQVGDHVVAEYHVSLAGEVRAPTAEELAHPLTVVDASARLSEEHAPAGGVARQVTAVATVERLDMTKKTVTLKGPRGNLVTIVARDPKKLEKLHVGDTIVVTYTEALAMSIEKAK